MTRLKAAARETSQIVVTVVFHSQGSTVRWMI